MMATAGLFLYSVTTYSTVQFGLRVSAFSGTELSDVRKPPMSDWSVSYNMVSHKYHAVCRCGYDAYTRTAAAAYRCLNIHYRVDECAYSPQNEQSSTPKSLPETEENDYNVSPFID